MGAEDGYYMCALKPSNYNRTVAYNQDWLLFNGVSSGLLLLNSSSYQKLLPLLVTPGKIRPDEFADPELVELIDRLEKGRFLVDESFNELEFLRERFRAAQYGNPVTVTIATTLDCNLGCYYCYEEREQSNLNRERCDGIFAHIEKLLRASPHKKLYVSWYGGEPMLNIDAIEYLSPRLIDFCETNGIHYNAHMVTNGTCWPAAADDCVSFVRRHEIKHVQFSFDGLAENHNNRRHYLKKEPNRLSSFDALSRTVNSLVGHASLYLRINVDKGSLPDAYPLVDYFHEQGWLYPGSRVYPYVAPLSPHTSACSSVGKTAIEHDVINGFQMEFRRYLSKYCDLREFISMNYYPRTVRLLCGAVSSRSVLFGPDGRIYKCVYDLGIHSLSHGELPSHEFSSAQAVPFRILPNSSSPNTSAAKPHDYMNYDPCSQPTCSKCEYLPICMGGCPKTQFEHNTYYTDEFKRFWDANLDTMLRSYADIMLRDPLTPLESLQTPFSVEAMTARKEIEAFGGLH
jgi:uncharacterized protein